jgi:hypothetical protein
MTDRFDLELRNRLDGLAAAVPVETPGSLGKATTAGVRAGSASRLLAPAALVSLVAVVLVGIAAGLARVGPFGPAASGANQSVGATPTKTSTPSENLGQVATDHDGDFELRLASDKSSYAPDEPIDVVASLVYRGQELSIDVVYQAPDPFAFGIRERIYGAIELQPLSRLMCAPKHATLTRDAPLTQPFQKSGGFPGNDPRADSFTAFMRDPVLRLPSGTWHIYAVGGVGPGCAQLPSPSASLEAELTIVVR